jgi:hypothetical protein
MKKFTRILIILTLMMYGINDAKSQTWTGKWIWQTVNGPANTWACFRKTVNLTTVPATVIANIAVDSKYWLWINGTMVVFEGGLKRGPNVTDTYYDEVDIAKYLTTGNNTISILVWHFGKDGYSHKNSTKGGLFFECNAEV